MAYHDDLLSQASQLVHTAPATQASLRRAVSTAYYAVFHLLIAEATANWGNVRFRAALGRAFDHGTMKTASNRILNVREFPYSGEDAETVAMLRNVALKFTLLQDKRHFADYNLTKDLDLSDALDQVTSAEQVFRIWPSIVGAQITQEYLVSLVVKNR